jgi:hypothetical protein
MAFGFTRRNYVAVQVTLTSANTNYNLLQLVNAILAAETGTDSNIQAPGCARNVQVQSNPGIDSSGANTADILFGDAKLSTSRYGTVLSPGGFLSDRSPINNVDFGEIYARSATAGQKLNITLSAG